MSKRVGFARIAELLNNPGRSYEVTSWSEGQHAAIGDPPVDAKGVRIIRKKVAELDEAISAAPDRFRREALEEERAKITDYLQKNTAIGGKPRSGEKTVKNARDRENNAVKRAIEAVRECGDSELAAYLEQTITLGSALVFHPKGDETWDVEQG